MKIEEGSPRLVPIPVVLLESSKGVCRFVSSASHGIWSALSSVDLVFVPICSCVCKLDPSDLRIR